MSYIAIVNLAPAEQERRRATWRTKYAENRKYYQERYQKNRERLAAQHIAWQKANPEKVAEHRRKSWLKNHKKNLERLRTRNQSHEYQRKRLAYEKRYYENPKRRLYQLVHGAMSRARKNGWAYDRDFLLTLASKPPEFCMCCGEKLNYEIRGSKRRGSGKPSVDRINSIGGYVRGNVAIICIDCNMAKRDYSAEYLQMLANFIRRAASGDSA